jgi:hypothetical protein
MIQTGLPATHPQTEFDGVMVGTADALDSAKDWAIAAEGLVTEAATEATDIRRSTRLHMADAAAAVSQAWSGYAAALVQTELNMAALAEQR